jgi:hypothetical protein
MPFFVLMMVLLIQVPTSPLDVALKSLAIV